MAGSRAQPCVLLRIARAVSYTPVLTSFPHRRALPGMTHDDRCHLSGQSDELKNLSLMKTLLFRAARQKRRKSGKASRIPSGREKNFERLSAKRVLCT